MTAEFPQQLPPQSDVQPEIIDLPPADQLGQPDQPEQPPVLSETATTILPDVAKVLLLDELYAGAASPQGALTPSRIKIRRLWEEATGSQDRDAFQTDLAAMTATIAAQGGPLGFLKAHEAEQDRPARARTAGTRVVGRMFGRRP